MAFENVPLCLTHEAHLDKSSNVLCAQQWQLQMRRYKDSYVLLHKFNGQK